MDIAVPNSGADTVSILFGKGDGTFTDAVHYPAGDKPRALGAGYCNADEKEKDNFDFKGWFISNSHYGQLFY
ncbi:MAG: hypothetical protein ACMUJM_17760 [bacterium]